MEIPIGKGFLCTIIGKGYNIAIVKQDNNNNDF